MAYFYNNHHRLQTVVLRGPPDTDVHSGRSHFRVKRRRARPRPGRPGGVSSAALTACPPGGRALSSPGPGAPGADVDAAGPHPGGTPHVRGRNALGHALVTLSVLPAVTAHSSLRDSSAASQGGERLTRGGGALSCPVRAGPALGLPSLRPGCHVGA